MASSTRASLVNTGDVVHATQITNHHPSGGLKLFIQRSFRLGFIPLEWPFTFPETTISILLSLSYILRNEYMTWQVFLYNVFTVIEYSQPKCNRSST